MVGKKKRVKAMKGKRVKAMGGKNVGMGKRVTAKKGKRVKAMKGKRVKAMKGKRVEARKGKDIKASTETELERKIRLGTKRMGPGKKRDEKVREIRDADRAARADKSASEYYTNNPDQIEKHARAPHGGDLFGAKKDLTDDMLRRDYKSGGEVGMAALLATIAKLASQNKKRTKKAGGGKMGKRVKAMGGKKVGTGKRVKAMKGKRVKAMGGTTMKGKRVKARGGMTMKGMNKK